MPCCTGKSHCEQVDVANFARIHVDSGFFETYQIDSLPLEQARPLWKEAHPYRPARAFEGEFLPKRHHFVDGGVLSNFPINASTTPAVPLRPHSASSCSGMNTATISRP